MKLVILMTAETERTMEVANAWKQSNASGVTILEGHGLYRLQEDLGIRDDMPLIPSLSALLRRRDMDTHILLSVVPDEIAEKLNQLAIDILGDMTIPGNGILLMIDVAQVIGLRQ
jgi:hypothetical protein